MGDVPGYQTNINIRLNPRIKAILRKVAKENGLTISEYVRQLIYADLRQKTIIETLLQRVKEEIRNESL